MDFSSIVGEELDEQSVQQANQIWEMLDNLAAKDPEGYKKFIENQKKQAEKFNEETKKPQPVFEVITESVKEKKVVLIQYCKHVKVEAPPDDEAAIPVVSMTPGKTIMNDKETDLYKLVFNPEIVDRCDSDIGFKKGLIELGLHCLEGKHSLILSREVRVDKCKEEPDYSSTAKQKGKQPPNTPKADDQPKPVSIDEVLKSVKQPNNDISLDQAVSDFNIEIPGVSPHSSAPLPGNKGNAQTTKSKPLISELAGSTISDETNNEALVYTVTHDTNRNVVVVRVALPNISSVGEVDVDITSDEVELTARKDFLKLQLPVTVDEDNAQAKFLKKKKELVITLPTLNS